MLIFFYRTEYNVSKGGNNVTVEVKREDMDTSMNAMDVDVKGLIHIDNFITSPFVTYNEYNENYATGLTLKLPEDGDVTPIELEGVEMVNNTNSQPAVLKPFSGFIASDENVSSPKAYLDPGDSAVIVTKNDVKEENNVFHVYNPSTSGSTKKAISFLDNVRFTVIKAADTVGAIGNFALKCYDVYNKIALGIPRWILPLSFAAASVDGDGYQIVSTSDISADDPNVDIENGVKLPFSVYDISYN